MKILHRSPRLYWLIRLFFPDYRFEVVHGFAFGDTIYSRHNPVPQDVLVHEKVHLKQMKYSKLYGVWHFARFVLSKGFRYRIELEAFRAQYKFCKNKGLVLSPHRMAKNLSEQKIYGRYVSYDEALMDILK